MLEPRKSKLNDARAVRSRSAMHTALLRLVETRPFVHLTVREICAEAGISVPTFYRQFATKEELLDDLAGAEIRRLMDFIFPLLARSESQSSALAICHHVHAHRELWRVLLTTGAAATMREECLKVAHDISAKLAPTTHGPYVELTAAVAISGMLEVLAWWLRQEAALPIAEMAPILDRLVVDPALHRNAAG